MLVNKYFCYLSFVCFRYSTWARWGILTRISRSCRSWTTRTLSGCGPSFSSSTTRSPTVLHSGTSHHLFQHTVFQEVKNCCSISSCIYGLRKEKDKIHYLIIKNKKLKKNIYTGGFFFKFGILLLTKFVIISYTRGF